ncbi:hypothetical protein PLEOSDRAFT_1109108 [Pleurotus ostreatus PC15]|uniref:Uncharacterized protein n=1 Tax=Pleurotus ostreatus (strain PC15) TaxID=1137138 RepID=A0A067NI88_PLEO1|nr:hypothetical protein PLEOSDRAFT_1109108 [Pleurotus ostreatus PC15]
MRLLQSKSSNGPTRPMGVPLPRRKSSGFKLEKGIGIDHVKVGMKMVASLAEGIDFPGLKGAAFLAYEIVEVADTVKTNKEDCRFVAECVWRLIDALVDSSARSKTMVSNARLTEDINRLGRDLERIKFILQLVASRRLLGRIFYHEADQKQIARCKDMIDTSLRVFSVYTGIQLRTDVFELKIRHTSDGDPILTKSVQISRVPPPKPRVFVGRDQVVNEGIAIICDAVRNQVGANVAILGTGGIGKTSLALAILHHDEVQTSLNGRCYFVPCDAINSVSALIHSILQVLDAPPGSVTDLISALHRCLESSDPLLLILDNFETPWYEVTSRTQVESVLARIAAIANVTLMITIRGLELPSEIQWITLPVRHTHGLPALTLEAAREAFWAHSAATPSADPESQRALDTLLEELSFVPLAVKLVAHAGKQQPPELLLKRWRKERNALAEAHGDKHDHLTSIDYSISLLVNSPILAGQKDVKQFLALLANLPDGIPDWTKNLEHMAPQFTNPMRLADVVQTATLVYPDSSGALKMLSPIRHHILDSYSLDSAHLAGLESYYITLVNQHAARSGPGLMTAVQILSPHINNIMSVMRSALRQHPSKVLVNATLKMSYFLYEVRPTCDLLEQMVKVLKVVDMAEMEPVAYHVMGDIWCREGKFVESRERLEKAYELFIAAGNENGQSQCLQSLAELCLRESKYSEAEVKIHQALGIYQSTNNALGIAQCQRRLGELLFSSDRYPEARESFEDALQKFEKINDKFGSAQCLRGLGEVLRVEDEYPDAREMLEKAYVEFKTLGNMFWQAQCLKSLADLLLREDKYKEASTTIEEAEAQFHQIRNALGLAECHQTQAELLQLEDKYLTAKELFTVACKEFKKIGAPLGEAKCLKSISEILLVEDDVTEARRTLEQAQELFNKIEKPFYSAQCLQGLGELLSMEENYPEAEAKLKEAVEEFVRLDNQIGEAQCLKTLGNILQLEDKYSEASEVLERAFVLFDDIEDTLGEAQCLRSLAEVLRLQGKYAEAHEKVQKSHEASSRIGDSLGIAQSLQVLGEILRMEGKTTEAFGKLQEALDLFDSIGDAVGAEQVEETLQAMKEGI